MRERRRASGAAVVAAATALAGCGDDSASPSGAVVPPATAAPTVSATSLAPDPPAAATTAPRGLDPTVASPASSIVFEVSVPTTVMVGDPGSPPVTVDDDYLDGVPPVSVPMAISEHLNQVQFAVRSIVGNEVFAGSAFTDDSGENGRITIYGTDVDAIESALDRIGTDLRDRLAVVASEYSFADLREVATQAEAAVQGAGLVPLWISPRYDGSGVDVKVERTGDHTDDELLAAATAALAGLPVFVTVSDPPIPA